MENSVIQVRKGKTVKTMEKISKTMEKPLKIMEPVGFKTLQITRKRWILAPKCSK